MVILEAAKVVRVVSQPTVSYLSLPLIELHLVQIIMIIIVFMADCWGRGCPAIWLGIHNGYI